MGMGASSVWESSRPPPHGRGGLLRTRTIHAPTACVWGPPPLWDHQGPRPMGLGVSFALESSRPCGMGMGASFALGSSRPPPHGQGGLLRFGIIEAPATLAWGPLCLWDPPPPHGMLGASLDLGPLWPRRMCVGTSFALGPPGPLSHGRRGLLRLGIIQAHVAWVQGSPSFWDQ